MGDESADAIATAARRLKDPTERRDYLDRVCDGDATLRVTVEQRLAGSEETLGFFITDDLIVEKSGDMIGRYRLGREIGRGGFGTVWLAEQTEPVKREVALKVIKLGMDTRQVVARFDQERQALAMMDHPNIARVLDAGATATGRPYFVMDLVKGDSIAAYCDRQRLTIARRLELFAQVCTAIQHAHGKGIIHRDLKPSNILVAERDGRPHATVIDFGIAKATSAKLTDLTLVTMHDQVVGTLRYMSPEQAEGSQDIDTRTDVYSLGVILYELLTGAPPFDEGTMKGAAFSAIQRMIREVDPPTPSSRLSDSKETLIDVAAHRSVEPRRLGTMIRGDLDWIVMKALEKDRSRRYETANGLALDIQRYLNGEPVTAAPPSAAYRIRKFVRRHKGAVAAGSAVAAALVVGIVGFAWQARVADSLRVTAEQQKTMAERQQRIAEDTAKAEAREKKRAVAINQFMTGALRAADPNVGGSQGIRVTDALANAVRALDKGAFKDDPDIEASLRSVVAEIFHRNGRLKDAQRLGERALGLYEQVHRGDHEHLANTLNLVATIAQDLGQYAKAEPLFVRSLEMHRRLEPGDHANTAMAMNNLANLYCRLGREVEAEPIMTQSLAMQRRLLQSDDPELAMAMNNLAHIRDMLGRREEAIELYEASLAIYEKLFDRHPMLAMALHNLGQMRIGQGRLEESETMLARSLAMYRGLFKGDHPDTARAVGAVANIRKILGKTVEAEALFREALETLERLFPGDHPQVATSLGNLALFYLESGRTAEAEALLLRALDMQRRLTPGGHPAVAQLLDRLATARRELKRLKEAEELLAEALEIRKKIAPNGDGAVVLAMNRLADVRRELGSVGDAEALSRDALALSRRLHEKDHPDTAVGLSYLGRILEDSDRAPDALPLLEESVAMLVRYYGRDHYDTAVGLTNLGRVRLRLGKKDEAREAHEQAVAMHRRRTPGGSLVLARALEDCGRARLACGDRDGARKDLTEALNLAERYLAADHPRIAGIRAALEDSR